MRRLLLVFLVLVAPAFGYSQASETVSSRLSLQVSPGILLPLGQSADYFRPGGSLSVSAEYRLPRLPSLLVLGSAGYEFAALEGFTQSISVMHAGVGLGYRWDTARWLALKARLSGGAFLGFLNDLSLPSANPFLAADAGASLLPGPWKVELGASFQWLMGLRSALGASLGVAYELPAGRTGGRPQEPRVRPSPLQADASEAAGAELADFSFDAIFPVFHAYYDDHPLGRAVLSNRLDRPLSDIRLSFFIKQYMDGPQDCPVPASLAPGESEEIQLYALFRPNILEVTEATKVQAEISLEYRVGAETGRRSFTHSLGVLDRNALTWEDDRRAAAFITAKDPVLLTFSKNVISAMRSSRVQGLNAQLLTALAIYEATNLRGLSYVPDPRGGYAQTSGKPEVDFLQFPRQTLEYKAGDCDDLSVLTCALLESVGIETAFITVPGHILMAFRLEMEPEEARQAFSRPDELILRSGQSWIPIEVTDRSGFLSAWQAGARQWRENLARGQVAFLPVHEAWKLYPPVGLPGAGTPPAAIGEEDVRKRAGAEIERFVTREIAPRALALEEQVRKAQDKRRPANELGVLYARYGLLERARAEFENILKGAEYLPALLNLANVLLLDGQKEQALACCQRAYAQDPGNPRVLLGLARVNHELENYFQARKAFEELKKKDPELSRRFAYLELRGEEAARAAEVGGLKEVILWEQ